MSLSNPNKPVTEERLAEFYQQILPYLGGMPEALANKFDKANLYSTTEKIVGCWTDGKPLYQIVVTGTAPNEINAVTTITTISNKNIKEVCFLKSIFKRASGAVYSVDSSNLIKLNDSTDLYPTSIWAGSPDANNNVDIKCRISHSLDISANVWSVVQYTKTTDAANSFKWGDENDYSTDEKIVGTYVNGEYIYQKTFSIGSFSGTNKTVAHNISNFDRCIKATMHLLNSNNNSWSNGCSTFYNGTNNWCSVGADKTNILVYMGSSMNWVTGCKVTLQYTKTTD